MKNELLLRGPSVEDKRDTNINLLLLNKCLRDYLLYHIENNC